MRVRNYTAFLLFGLMQSAFGSGCLLVAEEDPYDNHSGSHHSGSNYGSNPRPGPTPDSTEIVFDPLGPDVSLEGSWAINFDDGAGDRAANAANCMAAGIDTVQLLIYEDMGGAYIAPSSLKFGCEQGSFVLPAALVHGFYYYRWSALNSFGEQVASSSFETLDVMTLDSFETIKAIFTVDYQTASSAVVELCWDSIEGSNYYPGTCYDAGVFGGMQYTLLDPWGEVVAEGERDCADALEFTNLSWGEYELEVVGYAYSDDIFPTWETTCAFFVDSNGASTIECDVVDTDSL